MVHSLTIFLSDNTSRTSMMIQIIQMIMMMRIVMLGMCVGDCRDGLPIDVSDHTHCTHILLCRCLVLGSFAVLSSLLDHLLTELTGDIHHILIYDCVL